MNIKLKAKIASVSLAVLVLVGVVGVPGAHAALTEAQIQSILSLLNSFGADSATVGNVEKSLRGQPTSGAPSAPAGSCNFTRSLFVGAASGEDVKCLQQYLNSAGHQVAASGAGSAGSETTFFGSLTRAAVAKWQAANGVAPAAGYFGPLSQAKYDSVVAGAPGTPSTPGAPTPVGSGLTVSNTTQPAAALAPLKAARVPMVKAVFTASADGDVTVKSVTVERQGLADDDAFDSLVLLDEDGVQIGDSKTLNANHQVLLNEFFVVKAGTSKTITAGANMVSTSGSNAGQVAKLAIVAVDAGSSAVNASLPIVGNGMTINESLTIGSVDSPARGVRDPGAARDKLEIGTAGFIASGVRWSVGSAEPVILEQMRWYQSGSVASGDIKNVKVVVKDVEYDTVVSSDGKYYTAKLGSGVEFDKGATIDAYIKLDVDSGSNRTIDFDIQKRTDIVARGKTFNYHMVVANGTSDPADDTGAFSNTEPYYDAYQHTITKGSLRVEKSNAVAAGNVPEDVNGTALGAFTFEAKGEPVQVSAFTVSFTRTGTVDGDDITNVSLYDANGSVVAGPKDTASGEFKFSDTWTIPVGVHVYTLKGKIGTNAANNDTIQASTTPGTFITAKGSVTGLTITADPATAVTANTQTVKAATLAVSLSASPAAQNVVRGINGLTLARLVYDASASGEDLRITSQLLGLTPGGGAQANDLNTCQIFDGATALNTGGNVTNPDDTTANTEDALTFNLDASLIIAKGTIKTVDVKCNISNLPAANETFRMGLTSTNSDTTVTGSNTGTTVTETETLDTGPTMTIKTGGTLTVSLDSSSPSGRYGIAGKTDVVLSVLKFVTADEAIKLNKLALTLSSSTASTSDLLKVTLWDGATKIGETLFTGGNTRATSTLTGDFTVPKDGAKILTIKGDLALLGVNEPATRGHLIEVDYDGEAGGPTIATEGVGQNSGTVIRPTAGADTGSVGVRLVKSYPTLEKHALPSNSLTNGEIALYRFSVKAEAGDVALGKVTFTISSSTVAGATTSALKLYAYTGSNFSGNAYNNNPIHGRNVAKVGETTVANQTASTTDRAVFYFSPVANVAAGGGDPVGTAMVFEKIVVPAGTTRYFELRGTIASSGTGDSIQVALQGDASVGVDTNLVSRVVANAAAGNATDSDFVWSGHSTTSSATTTTDWLNGYLIPGLPGTQMDAQILSR